jgi:hypothetical protein
MLQCSGGFANLSDAFAQLPSKLDIARNKSAKTVQFLWGARGVTHEKPT